jgi:diguanylate cyclase (GGDEF)-like protein
MRYGGDEFIVMMRDIDDAGALVVAQRIRKLAKHYKFLFGGIEIPVTVSIGIGTLSDDMNDASELVEMADKYLYRAKRAGRNCIGGRAVKLAARSDWSTPTVRQA